MMTPSHLITPASLLLAALLCLIPSTSQAQDLEHAYKKEVAYLEAQHSVLTQRLTSLQKQNKASVAGATRRVDALQGKLLRLQANASSLEDSLQDTSRDAQTASDDLDILAGTLEQARASLKEMGKELAKVPESNEPEVMAINQAGRLDEAFSLVLDVLRTQQTVRTSSGSFFGPSGAKIEGQVVEVGQIASYGISPKASGALAPAGQGRLKLWGEPALRSAQGFAQGAPPAHVQIFLYESLKKNVEQKKEKTWGEFMKAGGLTGWVIVVLGLIGFLLVLIRLTILSVAGAGSSSLIQKIEPLLHTGAHQEALKLCGQSNSSAGRVLARVISSLGRSREALEDVVAEALLHEAPKLERFGTIILVFAASAPLLGLLGTVTGMISTFDIITEFGTGDPKMLSGGISEALITTQLGLVVAIPLLLFGNMTSGLAANVQTKLERSALRVMNLAESHTNQEGLSDA